MSNDLRCSVMTPETGIQRTTGGPPPALGGPPRAMGGAPQAAPRPAPSALVFAKRLDTLENKTVYLVDIGFGGGRNFMERLQKWFAENMPSVTTVVRRKPGRVFMDEGKELWEEIKAKGHAVVIGVAG